MAVFKRDMVDINLETGNIHRSFLNHSIGYKDQKADHFGIRVFRNGEPVDLTGVAVQGVFMPPQGSPIAITSGNIVSGNEAEVVLPQACYNYDGQFTLSIKLVDATNAVTGTMRIVDGMVDNTHASGTVAPTDAVPTYQEILAVYAQLLEDVTDYESVVATQDAKIDDLKSALTQDNILNNLISDAVVPATFTMNGITFTRKSASIIHVQGTATATGLYRFYNDHNNMPIWMPNGKYEFRYKATTDVVANIYFYKNGSYTTGKDCNHGNEIYSFTVTDNMGGLEFRLFVANGKTVNEDVSCELYNITQYNSIKDDIANEALTRQGTLAQDHIDNNLLSCVYVQKSLTSHGITFTRKTSSLIHVAGTTTGTAGTDYALYRFYFDKANMPDWMPKGNKYKIFYKATTAVVLSMYYYNGDSYVSGKDFTSGDEDYTFTVPSNITGVELRLSVAVTSPATTVDETVSVELFNMTQYNAIDGENITGTGNPVVLKGTKATGKLRKIIISDASVGDIISVSGKNIFFMGSDMQRRINNGVDYTFSNQQIVVTSEGSSANSVSSGDNFNTKYQKVNNINWWHNYKFMFTNDTPVTVSLNASQELYYDTHIQGQISDGTNQQSVDGNGLTFVAKANTEYGFRLVVYKGFSGTITIKPQIEIGLYATAYEKFKGGRYAITGNGTFNNQAYDMQEETTVIFIHNGSADITATAYGMGTTNKTDYSKPLVDKFNLLTFGKTPFIKQRKALVTFIDDDTSNNTLVQRYHDVFAAKNAVGGYAVMTKKLDENEGLAARLLQYEQEGFSCVYHCYYQEGDETRYWESGNPNYSETLIKENFMRGLRDMQEYGFSAYKYWVTPYGVCDDFIQSLARTHDMPCLFTMSGTMLDESFVNINGNCNRYNIPRISVSSVSNQAMTKRVIDNCIDAGGWLSIVTHANTWGDTTTMDDKLSEIIQYCKDAGAEIVSVPYAFSKFAPYFYWSELLS